MTDSHFPVDFQVQLLIEKIKSHLKMKKLYSMLTWSRQLVLRNSVRYLHTTHPSAAVNSSNKYNLWNEPLKVPGKWYSFDLTFLSFSVFQGKKKCCFCSIHVVVCRLFAKKISLVAMATVPRYFHISAFFQFCNISKFNFSL